MTSLFLETPVITFTFPNSYSVFYDKEECQTDLLFGGPFFFFTIFCVPPLLPSTKRVKKMTILSYKL